MNATALHTIYADIDWLCFPKKVEIAEKEGWRYIRAAKRQELLDVLNRSPSRLEDESLWRDVNQLYFAFNESNYEKIKAFYSQNGFLHVLPRDRWRRLNLPEEDWEYTLAALEWFNLLISMTWWLKNENLGPLREVFNETKEISLPGLKIKKPYLLKGPPNSGFDIFTNHWPHPKDDGELRKGTWAAITTSLYYQFNRLTFGPPEVTSFEMMTHAWYFEVYGAFQAAFLQWYFQELAGYGLRKCARDGCDNVVVPTPKKRGKEKIYCDQRCRWAANKQKQREKTNS